jgi:hypothetical protein
MLSSSLQGRKLYSFESTESLSVGRVKFVDLQRQRITVEAGIRVEQVAPHTSAASHDGLACCSCPSPPYLPDAMW